jgi:hypothetical protein
MTCGWDLGFFHAAISPISYCKFAWHCFHARNEVRPV